MTGPAFIPIALGVLACLSILGAMWAVAARAVGPSNDDRTDEAGADWAGEARFIDHRGGQ